MDKKLRLGFISYLSGNRHKICLMLLLLVLPAFISARSYNRGKFPIPERFKVKNYIPLTPPLVRPLPIPKAPIPISASTPAILKTPGEKIFLENAEALSYDKLLNPEYQILRGNVCFRHDNARLYCDSAYFYQLSNSLYAFGHVHMEQGDTLFLYGAWMYYDGNNKLAKVREKVRLENRDKVTLFTDSLNYDRLTNIAYFFDGGLLVDDKNQLSSEYGQYSPATKVAQFKNTVKLVNPKFVMTTEQLNYNTRTDVADIFSPTEIKSDSGYIFTTKGWYNTKNEHSMLLDRSYAISNKKRLTADTLFYNDASKIGDGYGNVVIEDSTRKVTLKGGYGHSESKNDYSLLTRKALLIEHSSKDTVYLHGDTLISSRDSTYKELRAKNGTRFFRSDLQGLCDSMYYTTRDSVLKLYGNPVLWSEQQQLSGEYMELHTKNKKPDVLNIQRSAMAIAFEADSLYDQSSGKDLKAFFDDSSEVVRVDITGNAESVYLPRDKDKQLSGLNRLEGSSMTMFRKDGKMNKLVVWPQPKGKFYPMEKLDPQAKFLKNFKWLEDQRPKNPDDVFRVIRLKSADKSDDAASGTVKRNVEKKKAPSKTVHKSLKRMRK